MNDNPYNRPESMSGGSKYINFLLGSLEERQRVQANYERACAANGTEVKYDLVDNLPLTVEQIAEMIVDMGSQNYGVHVLIAHDGIGTTCTCHGVCIVCGLGTSEKDSQGRHCHSYHPQYGQEECEVPA